MKGKFITFEGSEGCGKSTQSRLLYEYLKKRGKRVVYLREPGATLISEKIREVLLDARNQSIVPQTEMLLYMAARAQIVGEMIEPALKKGITVICDRFLDSTIAYQGYGIGMDINLIKVVGKFATRNLSPGLTLFLDLAVKKGLRHRQASLDRIEMRSIDYHQRVRRGYLALAKAEPGRIKIVKVLEDKFKTQENVRKLVEKYVF